MAIFPRPGYGELGRYRPDCSPVAADLGDNRNLWGAHPAALDVLARVGSDGASRYPDSYAEGMAEAAARVVGALPCQICTGAGATGVLDALMRATAPTSMRYLDPGWPAAEMLARMNGHAPVPVEWTRALEDPIKFAGTRPCLVFVANPGNPTGEAVPDDWIRAVWTQAESVGSVLILDEAYGEYHRDPRDRAAVELALAGERSLCVRTMSKAYGLAGLRAGYGVGSASVVLEVDKARGPFAVSAASSAAAAAALCSDAPWLGDAVAQTRRVRDRLTDCLRQRGYDVPESSANFVFIRRPREEVERIAVGLESLGVRTRPFLGATARGSGLRATVGPWPLMERLLDALDRVDATGA